MSPTEWRTILAKLRRARLLAGEDPHNPGDLDTHPLVREYFGEQLRSQRTEAWKECNKRLFNYYRALAPQLPESFAETEPLFLAVICGCNAGLFREALNEVNIPRIQRGNAHFAAKPRPLYVALVGQWRYFLMTDTMTTALQVAKRVYSLAQEQNDSALMMGACRPLAATLYFMGDFEPARQYAMHGVQMWRSGGVQSPDEEVMSPAIICLCYDALCEWHFAQIDSSQATIAESMSLARELNDTHALALALYFAACLGRFERNLSEVERCASLGYEATWGSTSLVRCGYPVGFLWLA